MENKNLETSPEGVNTEQQNQQPNQPSPQTSLDEAKREKSKRIKIALLALVAVVLAVVGILLLKTMQPVLSPQPQTITNQQLEIDNTSNWRYFYFPEGYKYNFKIPIPPNWQVICCGDTGDFSVHTIRPVNSSFDDSPVVVYDFALHGCLDGDFKCALDETITLSSAQFLDGARAEIERTGEFLKIGGWSALRQMDQIEVQALGVIAYRYEGYIDTKKKIPIELYLFDTGAGVSAIVFSEPDKLGRIFVKEFLEHASPLWETYRNDEFGFEVKYPKVWEIQEEGFTSVSGIFGASEVFAYTGPEGFNPLGFVIFGNQDYASGSNNAMFVRVDVLRRLSDYPSSGSKVSPDTFENQTKHEIAGQEREVYRHISQYYNPDGESITLTTTVPRADFLFQLEGYARVYNHGSEELLTQLLSTFRFTE